MNVMRVKKNSGHTQKFSLKKLAASIEAAQRRTDISAKNIAGQLAHETLIYLEKMKVKIIEAAQIREAVLHVMRQRKDIPLAEAYELTSLHLLPGRIGLILKRNGRRESFHPVKLFKSIAKSFRDAGIENGVQAQEITKEIAAALAKEYDSLYPIPVENIRKKTAELIRKKGFARVERSYVLHKYL